MGRRTGQTIVVLLTMTPFVLFNLLESSTHVRRLAPRADTLLDEFPDQLPLCPFAAAGRQDTRAGSRHEPRAHKLDTIQPLLPAGPPVRDGIVAVRKQLIRENSDNDNNNNSNRNSINNNNDKKNNNNINDISNNNNNDNNKPMPTVKEIADHKPMSIVKDIDHRTIKNGTFSEVHTGSGIVSSGVALEVKEVERHALKIRVSEKRNVTLLTRDDVTLMNCHSNKTCLERELVPLALTRARENDPSFWSAWLKQTAFQPNYTLPVIWCPEHESTFAICIHSHPSNIKQRQMIRRSWGSVKEYNGVRVFVVFMLAQPENETIQGDIVREARQYNDLIQGGFTDSYKNLTWKNRMDIHWIYNYCSNSKYVLKMDDDVFISIFRLVDMATTVMSAVDLPVFYCSEFSPRAKPYRNANTSKWALSMEEYPRKFFPPMCAGRGYVARTETFLRLHVLASHVRSIWIDDLWLTGIVGRLAGAKFTALFHKPLTKHKFFGPKQTCFYDIDMTTNDVEQVVTNVWEKTVKNKNTRPPAQEISCIIS